jgi:hypothetical protein
MSCKKTMLQSCPFYDFSPTKLCLIGYPLTKHWKFTTESPARSCDNDASVDADATFAFGQHRPQDTLDIERVRIGSVEAGVRVGVETLALVIDNERRGLERQRPREAHTLLNVVQQACAGSQRRVVVECLPDSLTNILNCQQSPALV